MLCDPPPTRVTQHLTWLDAEWMLSDPRGLGGGNHKNNDRLTVIAIVARSATENSRLCRWSRFYLSPAQASDTRSSPLQHNTDRFKSTAKLRWKFRREENRGQMILASPCDLARTKCAHRPFDGSWGRIAWCPSFPRQSKFQQHPFPAPWVCRPHQSSIFQCPEKSRRSTCLQNNTTFATSCRCLMRCHHLGRQQTFWSKLVFMVKCQPFSRGHQTRACVARVKTNTTQFNSHTRTHTTHTNQFLLLNELHVGQGFWCQFDRLIEAIFTTIRYIHDLDDLGLQSLLGESESDQIWSTKRMQEIVGRIAHNEPFLIVIHSRPLSHTRVRPICIYSFAANLYAISCRYFQQMAGW